MIVTVGMMAMSDEKIYVDASRPATLNNGGALDDCLTLQEGNGVASAAARN